MTFQLPLDEGTRLVIREIAREVNKELLDNEKLMCDACRMFTDKEDRNSYYNALHALKNCIENQKDLAIEIKKLKGGKLKRSVITFVGSSVGAFCAYWFGKDFKTH